MDMLLDLINLAQGMLENGFDSQIFQDWEFLAFLVLLASLGPFHYYTQNFKRLTAQKNQQALLAGEGILIAAKETLSQQRGSDIDQTGSNVLLISQHSGILDRIRTRLRQFASTGLGETSETTG
jgi:hypothetical protein